MIVERAARARQIAESLRNLAARLEDYQLDANPGLSLGDDIRELRATADQIENL